MVERRRRARIERERRIEDLAVQVVTAIVERDEAVAQAEQRAGAALRELTDVEGLSLAEAVEWCDEQVSAKEATRLRRPLDDGRPGQNAGRDASARSGGAGPGTPVG
ncbi:hypothetical protein D0Z08_28375 [Nocardioides immobilis]|uniref:Uncharacterized protein n=2 Tax=Nocardioides immobilis TaxID=2049295 RepID=A0A417XU33_9ACTN|nr:hypothetical protein D0Z08_28375 [Nocardioides immobilis]